MCVFSLLSQKSYPPATTFFLKWSTTQLSVLNGDRNERFLERAYKGLSEWTVVVADVVLPHLCQFIVGALDAYFHLFIILDLFLQLLTDLLNDHILLLEELLELGNLPVEKLLFIQFFF